MDIQASPLAALAAGHKLWAFCHCPDGRLLSRSRNSSSARIATVGGPAVRGAPACGPLHEDQGGPSERLAISAQLVQSSLTRLARHEMDSAMAMKSCHLIMMIVVGFGFHPDLCRARPRATAGAPVPTNRGLVILAGGVGGLDFFVSAAEWALPHAGVPHEIQEIDWSHGFG